MKNFTTVTIYAQTPPPPRKVQVTDSTDAENGPCKIADAGNAPCSLTLGLIIGFTIEGLCRWIPLDRPETEKSESESE